MQIIDSETFTKTEDHEVLIEKKRYELEHRCVCPLPLPPAAARLLPQRLAVLPFVLLQYKVCAV